MKAGEENNPNKSSKTLSRFPPRRLINYHIQHPEKKITAQYMAALHTGKEVSLFSGPDKVDYKVDYIDDAR